MRLLIPSLLLSLFPVISVTAITFNDSIPQQWEVLEGCRLIKAPINDGDSFKLTHADRELIIRLYYVDCPEMHDTYRNRLNDQSRYFAISESQVLAAGKAAKAYTQKFLKGEFTVITRWEDARGSGGHKRYFGIVQKGNRLLSAELINNGLARIYGMPTQDCWPNGFPPEVYLKQLKQHERTAQMAGKGLWADAHNSAQWSGTASMKDRTEIVQSLTAHAFSANNQTGRIILNTAVASELEALPGIGPALAERIIERRPFAEINELAEIPGISMKKINAFRNHVVLDEPRPPPMTADFYLAESETYLNQEVTVRVVRVTQSGLTAPNGFHAVNLETANQGQPGGSISAFIPEEYYGSFTRYYRQSNREFTGLLFRQDSNIVLVYRRK